MVVWEHTQQAEDCVNDNPLMKRKFSHCWCWTWSNIHWDNIIPPYRATMEFFAVKLADKRIRCKTSDQINYEKNP